MSPALVLPPLDATALARFVSLDVASAAANNKLSCSCNESARLRPCTPAAERRAEDRRTPAKVTDAFSPFFEDESGSESEDEPDTQHDGEGGGAAPATQVRVRPVSARTVTQLEQSEASAQVREAAEAVQRCLMRERVLGMQQQRRRQELAGVLPAAMVRAMPVAAALASDGAAEAADQARLAATRLGGQLVFGAGGG